MTKQSYIIRMQLDGGRQVTTTLNQIGTDGERSMKQLESGVARVDSQFDRFTLNLVRRYLPAFSGAMAVRSISRNIQEFEKIDFRLRRLTESSEDYVSVQKFLSDSAQTLNIDIEALANNYARLLALQDAGVLNRAQVNELAAGFANLKAALGVGDSQIDNVLYGLSQALSQGTVQAQELNQVIEPVPGFLNKIADAAGTTAGGFREMVKSGEISSERFRDVVLTALREYEGAAEEMSDTWVAASTRLSNSWKELSRAIGKTGLIDAIADLTSGTARFVEEVTDAAKGTQSWAQAFRDLTREMALYQMGLAGLDDGISFRAGGFTEQPIGDSGPGSRAGMASFQQRLMEQMGRVSGLTREAMSVAFAPDGTLRPINAPVPGEKPQEIYDRAFKEQDRAAKEAERRAKAIQDVVEALKFENEQLMRTTEEQELYNALQQAGVELDSARGREIEALVRRHQELQRAIAADKEAIEELNRQAKTFGDAWGDAADRVLGSFESIGDAAADLVNDLYKMFIRETISDPIRDFAGDLFKSMAGSFGGTRAAGGPIEQGKWYIAGEHGPEPIWGGGPGAFATGYGNMGGGNVDLKVNVINQTSREVDADVSRSNNGRDIDVILVEKVKKAIGNGSLDRTMRSRYGISPSVS